MIKLSIKAKVTIWYTVLLIIILMVVLVFVINFSDNFMISKAKIELTEVVQDNAGEISVKNGEIDLSDLENNSEGSDIVVHEVEYGELIFGKYPMDFPEKFAFTNGIVKTVSAAKKKWLVYDYLVISQKHETVFVRGIYSMDTLAQTINIATVSTLMIFPILILIAAFGGYCITKRAFRPVKQISIAATEIIDGHDLSKRIGLKGSGDEIASLAHAFDAMFDRLQRSFERERQFTADASHELRTPTTVIMSQCEYALSEIDNKEEVAESLKKILRQSQKMSGLISQLLLLTRTENKETKLVFEQFDFSELVEIVADEMKALAKTANIELIYEIEPSILFTADQSLMARLLINLISNGIKYGKNGGFVKLHVSKDKNQLVVSVSDNGIGIGEEHIERIWDRFYQVNPSRTSDNEDSMGFGLSMVKWILEAHKGIIEVKSILGEGTTFTFYLPITSNLG